ncbi:MAG: hypothetical protein ACR2PX_22960 [Endozoicomonas sp.]|uniref:hypothetical protein n=1 Tax=Endozoicomonas sp. TaxID=1892382 RepID=UPI003D9BBB8E
MKHTISNTDQSFRTQVESCAYPVTDFNHRAHLRLAYIYLSEGTTDEANDRVRETLTRILIHNKIEPASKYHETLTKAWLMAMNHFMQKTVATDSADEFINKNPIMLDSSIMKTHYSDELLFSELAKKVFVEPDLAPIPG